MSSQQLWAPQQQSEQNAQSVRVNMVPGTWLQLSPISSAITSPAVDPETGSPTEPKDELLLTPSDSKFLSNQSRTSSVSSSSSSVRHPSLGQRVGAHCSIERREASLARTGSVSHAFSGNH